MGTFVPRNLDMQDRQQWLESNQELLVKCSIPIQKTFTLVTGDETWLHHLDPYTKTSPCIVCTLAQPTLEISYTTISRQGNTLGVLGLQRIILIAYKPAGTSRCQCH